MDFSLHVIIHNKLFVAVVKKWFFEVLVFWFKKTKNLERSIFMVFYTSLFTIIMVAQKEKNKFTAKG